MLQDVDQDVDIDAIRAMYSDKDSLCRKLFDRLAERQRRPKNGYTSVDQVQEWFREHTRPEAVHVLKQLAQHRAGTFLVGRWEWPSRLEWDVNAISLAKVLVGEAEELENDAEYSEEEEDGSALSEEADGQPPVQLRLRPGVIVQIENLPADLSKAEAERLCSLIMAQPCES